MPLNNQKFNFLFFCFVFSRNESSSSDFSDNSTAIETQKSNYNHITASTVTISRISTPTSSVSVMDRGPLLETILKRVEHLVSVQDQHSIILRNLLEINQLTSVQALNRPQDMPNLPITTKPEFKALEDFLKIEETFNYMVCYLILLLLVICCFCIDVFYSLEKSLGLHRWLEC